MATRAELATLKNLSTFTDRIMMCTTFYAQYIINEPPSTQNHNRRFQWAETAVLNPTGTASQISALVSIDPTFANVASPVGDWNTYLDALPETGPGSVQQATENAINDTILQF